MKFTKMQGLGNDYIYVDCMKETVDDPVGTAVRISDRHFGVGSDGLILVKSSEIADYRMEIYNADGSVAEMCGNGVRCVGKFLCDNGYVTSDTVSVETGAGIKLLRLIIKDGECVGARVDMGEPVLTPSKIPVRWNADTMIDEEITVGGKTYNVTCVSMGNPHAVVFTDDVDSLNLEVIGSLFEHHSLFPARVNTEFVKVIDKNTVNMRVWERGSGETWSCGTGACAVAIAACENGLCKKGEDIKVKLIGGDLIINYTDDKVYMTGNAVKVFDGEVTV